jgi:hypothetical protein
MGAPFVNQGVEAGGKATSFYKTGDLKRFMVALHSRGTHMMQLY